MLVLFAWCWCGLDKLCGLHNYLRTELTGISWAIKQSQIGYFCKIVTGDLLSWEMYQNQRRRPATDEFPTQRASNAEKVSIWLCHHSNLYINIRWITITDGDCGDVPLSPRCLKLPVTWVIFQQFVQADTKYDKTLEFHLMTSSRRYFAWWCSQIT